VAAVLLWWVSRPEPAGQTVSSVGASGALELAAPSATSMPSTPPNPPAAPASASPPESPSADPTTSAPINPPAHVHIAVLDVDAPVIPVGVGDDGEVQVPGEVATVGWYRFGPVPGAPGSAVLVGHVDDYRQGTGVLARIGELNPGDAIEIADDDGGTRRFTVVAREQWAKADTPMPRLFDRGGPPRLVVITCGGRFDEARLGYDDNIAVTAVPVG
jgi:sortase (surface protein transpeptidase)